MLHVPRAFKAFAYRTLMFEYSRNGRVLLNNCDSGYNVQRVGRG